MNSREMFKDLDWNYHQASTYTEVSTNRCQITVFGKESSLFGDSCMVSIRLNNDYDDRITESFSKQEALAIVKLIKEQEWLHD